MSSKPQILVTERGRELLSEKRRKIQDELRAILAQKSEAAENGGDAWHDNFSFENLTEQERVKNAELKKINEEIQRMKLVGMPAKAEVLQIGHLATVELDDGTEFLYEVAGYGETDINANPQKIEYLAPVLRDLFGHETETEAEVNLQGMRRTVVLTNIQLKEEQES